MRNDWGPYVILLTLVCLGFAALSWLTLGLLSNREHRKKAQPIVLVVVCIMLSFAIAWVYAARRDWQYMDRILKLEIPAYKDVGAKPNRSKTVSSPVATLLD